jgi:hypothetical protein
MEKTMKTPAASDIEMGTQSDVESGIATEKRSSVLARVGWLNHLLSTVETTGIHRVTDEQRKANTTKVWNAFTFW